MVKFWKKFFLIFLSYCPLKILKFDVAILQMQYLKSIKAKDLKPVLAAGLCSIS